MGGTALLAHMSSYCIVGRAQQINDCAEVRHGLASSLAVNS